MKLLTLYVYIYFFIAVQANAQNSYEGVWKTLGKVSFKTKKQDKYEIDYPVFSSEVKALQGKTIVVKGYIIPLSELDGQSYFVFSALPYNLCYFCGSAGPETVMEVYSRQKIPYTSKPIKMKGKLRLNNTDSDHLMYILEDAVKVN